MASIHEILLQITGTSDQAREELAKVARDVSEFSREDAEAQIRLGGILKAREDLATLKAQLTELDHEHASPEVRIQSQQALADINVLDRELGAFWSRELQRRKAGTALFDPAEFNREQAQMVASVEALGNRIRGALSGVGSAGKGVRVPIDLADFDSTERRVLELETELRAIDHEKVTPEIRINLAKAFIDLELLKRKFAEVRHESEQGDAGMVSAAALTTLLAGAQAAEKAVGGVTQAVGALAQEGEQASGMLSTLGEAAKSTFGSGPLGEAAGVTRDLTEILQVAVVVIIVGLIPAVLALAGALAGAITGAVGLASAFAAALGPALLLLIETFRRLSAIFQAFQAMQQQGNKSTQDASTVARQAAQSEQARASALAAVRDAHQSVISAERALSEARKTAADNIARLTDADRQAQQGVADAIRGVAAADRSAAQARTAARQAIAAAVEKERQAEQSLGDARKAAAERHAASLRTLRDAERQLSEQVQAAYRAWTDAQQAVIDKTFALEDAQLGIADAVLSQQEAQQRVNELLTATPGLAQQALDVLKKLQDVDLGPGAFAGVAASIQTIGGSDPSKAALALQRALLELARAKLGVSEASNRETKAEGDLGDARKSLNDFTTQGINAYKPYTDAVRAVTDAQTAEAVATRESAKSIRDAQQAVTAATRTANTLRQQGVAQNPQVLAAVDAEASARSRLANAEASAVRARQQLLAAEAQGVARAPAVLNAIEAVRNAQERLADSQRRAATAGDTFGKLPADANRTNAALANLNETERTFLGILGQVYSVFRATFGQGSNIIIASLGQALLAIVPLMKQLTPLMNQLASVLGGAIVRGVQALSSPAWSAALRTFFTGAIQLATPVLGIIGSMLTIFRNLAVAVMPLLISLFGRGARALAGLAGQTGNIGQLRATFKPLVDDLAAIGSLVWQAINLFVAFGQAAGPAGGELVKWLAQAAGHLAAFLRSGPGLAIVKQFFADTLPFVKTLVSFLGQLGVAFLQSLQIVLPMMQPIFQIFTEVMRVANALLLVIVAFLRPLGLMAGNVSGTSRALTTLHAVASILVTVLGVVASVVRTVGGVFSAFAGLVESVFKAVINSVVWVVNKGIDAINWVIQRINDLPSIDTPLGHVGFPHVGKIGHVPSLAGGGVTTGPTLAQIGEAGREAVLPLTRNVFGEIASLLAGELRNPGGSLGSRFPAMAAQASAGAPAVPHTVIEHQDVNVTTHEGGLPDARTTAGVLAMELRRRGGPR